MPITSVADQARSYHLRQQHAHVKSDLTRLTQELASGQTSDMTRTLGGDYSALAGIERSLRLTEAYRTAGAEAALVTSSAQSALATVQAELDQIGPSLLAATGVGVSHEMEIVAHSAGDRLNTAIAMLNQEVAGRALFSGTATDTAPLITGDALLTQLAPLAAGATDAADLIATLDSWFMDPGGGFETPMLPFTTGRFASLAAAAAAEPAVSPMAVIRTMLASVEMLSDSLLKEAVQPSALQPRTRALYRFEAERFWMV